MTLSPDQQKLIARVEHLLVTLFVDSADIRALIAIIRELASRPADLTWFWEIVDRDGLRSVPSDEREALNRICRDAARITDLEAENKQLREEIALAERDAKMSDDQQTRLIQLLVKTANWIEKLKRSWPISYDSLVTEIRQIVVAVLQSKAAERYTEVSKLREALETIRDQNKVESRTCVNLDPAGTTYLIENVDGPFAIIAREALRSLHDASKE